PCRSHGAVAEQADADGGGGCGGHEAQGYRSAASGGIAPARGTLYARRMKLLIVGCGRVGSSIARNMADDGHDVSVIDEDPEALQRLPESWPGRFVHGHGLDTE